MEEKYSWQLCQDEEMMKKFGEFHVEIVNQIIKFCKDNNLQIDEFYLGADGLKPSIEEGEWLPCSDSSFSLSAAKAEKPYLLSL